MMHWIDPGCLPETQGAVESFIANRHDEIDGLLVAPTGQAPLLVCTPPHLFARIEAAVKIGDTIRIRGIRPRRADIIAAAALTASNGDMIVDDGPPDEDKRKVHRGGSKPNRTDAELILRLSLFGPKGELRRALLQEGVVVRLGPKEAASVAGLLRPGSRIAVRGPSLHTKHGRVVAAEEIGPDWRRLKPARASGKEKKKNKTVHAGAFGVLAEQG